MTTNATPDNATANARRLGRRVRNDSLVDIWSAAHFAWGVLLTVLLGPFWAIGLLILWEPIEIFFIGPRLARWGIPFGHETWRNSLSDIVFDAAGAVLGFFVVLAVWDPLGIR